MASATADDFADDDDAVLPRKRRGEGEEMDITPMIDITFLLLIFFVVCSTMKPTKSSDIPEADNGSTVLADDSAVLFIEPAGEDKVVVRNYNGKEFSRDEDEQVAEIVEYVTEELERTDGKSKKHVMIFGDQDTPMGQVKRVQTIIGDAFDELESTYVAVKEQ